MKMVVVNAPKALAGILKKIYVISKAHPVIGAIAFEICKAVNKTFDQR